MSKRVVYIVDGNSLCHKYAVSGLSSNGVNTGAAFHFVNWITERIRLGCDIPIFVFDHPDTREVGTWRSKYRTVDYRGQRTPQKHDMLGVFGAIMTAKMVLRRMGAIVVEKKGVEADDIIWCLSRRVLFGSKKSRVVIMSGDMDLWQCVTPRCAVYITSRAKAKDGTLMCGRLLVQKNFEDVTGMQSIEDWNRFRAFVGDKSDNILGVRGVGPVKAAEFMEKYSDRTWKQFKRAIERVWPEGHKALSSFVVAYSLMNLQYASRLGDLPELPDIERVGFENGELRDLAAKMKLRKLLTPMMELNGEIEGMLRANVKLSNRFVEFLKVSKKDGLT